MIYKRSHQCSTELANDGEDIQNPLDPNIGVLLSPGKKEENPGDNSETEGKIYGFINEVINKR